MTRHHITPLRTTFQHQNEVAELAAEAVRRAYDHGFRIGEQVGARRVRIDRALGIGFVIGVAFGVVVAAAVAGWPV